MLALIIISYKLTINVLSFLQDYNNKKIATILRGLYKSTLKKVFPLNFIEIELRELRHKICHLRRLTY